MIEKYDNEDHTKLPYIRFRFEPPMPAIIRGHTCGRPSHFDCSCSRSRIQIQGIHRDDPEEEEEEMQHSGRREVSG